MNNKRSHTSRQLIRVIPVTSRQLIRVIPVTFVNFYKQKQYLMKIRIGGYPILRSDKAVPHNLLFCFNPSNTHTLCRGSLPCLRYLVLDEADRLLQASQCQWLPKLMASRTSHTSPLSTTLHTLSSLPHVHDPLHPLMVQPVKQVCVQKLLFSATMTFDPEHLSVLRLNRPLLFCVSDADSAFTLPTRLEEVT